MKPNFVLNLSHEGIGLLHRAIDGWHLVGDVRLDDPAFMDKLGYLRQTAASLDKNGIKSKIVIPNSQILYTSLEIAGQTETDKHTLISNSLDGLTPYSIDELSYDYRESPEGLQVAAVAKETLAEAESFAADHGFNPVCFVAIPDKDIFNGEPFFGETAGAAEILNGFGALERDTGLIKIVQTPKKPVTVPISDESAAPTPQTPDQVAKKTDTDKSIDADLEPDTAPKIELPAFSSRRDTDSNTPANSTLDRIEKIASKFDLTDDQSGAKAPKLGGAQRKLTTAPFAADTSPNSPTTAPERQPSTKLPIENPASSSPANPPSKRKIPAFKISNLTLGLGRKSAVETGQPIDSTVKKSKPKKPPKVSKKAAVSPATTPDEAESLTVFGARKKTDQRGKPRFLGLILMLVLVAALLGIAFWSTYFLDDVSRLWRGDDKSPTIAQTETQPDQDPNNSVSTALALLTEPITQPDLIDPSDQSSLQVSLPTEQTETSQAQDPDENSVVANLSDDTIELELEPEPQMVSELDPTLFERQDQKTNAVVTPEVAQAAYLDTGIWQLPPDASKPPAADDIRSLYITSIDLKTHSHDAVALPPASGNSTDFLISTPTPPAAPNTTFVLDDRGLVIPSKDGTLNVDGILVYAGPPPIRPGTRPVAVEQPSSDIVVGADQRLAGFRPKYRPKNLIEGNERANLGGYTRQQLAKIRPKPRPISPKTQEEADETPTAQAVAISSPPSHRPKRFAALVKKALAQAAQSSPSESATATVAVPRNQTIAPRIPTRASVARQATIKNAIHLRRVNLIGVYGKPSSRKALIRLPSGRYVKVKVGQRVDGGKVAAIGKSSLKYVKGGRTITLKMPKT